MANVASQQWLGDGEENAIVLGRQVPRRTGEQRHGAGGTRVAAPEVGAETPEHDPRAGSAQRVRATVAGAGSEIGHQVRRREGEGGEQDACRGHSTHAASSVGRYFCQ